MFLAPPETAAIECISCSTCAHLGTGFPLSMDLTILSSRQAAGQTAITRLTKLSVKQTPLL